MQELFREIDQNGDKYLEISEIIRAMRTIGVELSEQEALEMISPFDLDKNQKLDFFEFKKLMEPRVYENLLEQDDRDE